MLVLTLEDGPLVHVEIKSAAAIIGWLHMVDLEVLMFDGEKISIARPRT
jgi:hypothetical protein